MLPSKIWFRIRRNLMGPGILSRCTPPRTIRVLVLLVASNSRPPRFFIRERRNGSLKLGRYKGGRELLAAVGFCDELRVEAGRRHSDERAAKSGAESAGDSFAQVERGTREESSFASNRAEREGWLVLEGTVGHDGKPAAAVGEAQLKVLRATRDEVRKNMRISSGITFKSLPYRLITVGAG